MSTSRGIRGAPFDGAAKVPHPKTGRLVHPCRWCGTPVSPPRVFWCSDTCVQEYLIRKGGREMRAAVFERDRGVCATCRLDTRALEDWLLRMKQPRGGWRGPARAFGRERRKVVRRTHFRLYDRPPASTWCGSPHNRQTCDCRYHRAARELERRGFRIGQSFWEADHIRPVVEGGGSCGTENLRTLCRPCHRRVSAELARRRALERRGLQELPLVTAPAPFVHRDLKPAKIQAAPPVTAPLRLEAPMRPAPGVQLPLWTTEPE